MDQVRADVDSGRADNDSGHADDDSSRVDDDSGRADVVGEVASFVHGEEVEAGIGAGSSFKLRQARQTVRGAGTQGPPGLLRSRFDAIRPGRRHPPERPKERRPSLEAAPAAI
jgi:hypothetical protein